MSDDALRDRLRVEPDERTRTLLIVALLAWPLWTFDQRSAALNRFS